MQIILSSSSKPRLQLLKQIGIKAKVKSHSIDEQLYFKNEKDYNKAILNLAIAKAEDCAKHFDDSIIIGADTIIVYKNKIFQKPKTIAEAKQTLGTVSALPGILIH